ncbi:CcdB family protein [Roseomonas sp. HJA6]|uniref:Toxin CcdB n=1 Tax=Roseomonas alba TaxID=2846776 RepID=A0ABS7A839_9PROT|nr:CcdB family protein [Neoroseomonas alba]
MARFDLHRAPGGAAGYVVNVQSDLLDHLQTRVVVPLLPPDRVPPAMPDLHPNLAVQGEAFLLATQLLAAVPRRELGPVVGSLASERDAITRALDLLLTGF